MSTRTFVRRIWSLASISAVLVALTTGSAWAAPNRDGRATSGVLDAFTLALIVDDDVFSNADLTTAVVDPGATHFGPFPSQTTDSGTCGTDWAADSMNRFFTVRLVSAGPGGLNTYQVYEQFKDGSFATFMAPSPGACDSSDGTPPGAISAKRRPPLLRPSLAPLEPLVDVHQRLAPVAAARPWPGRWQAGPPPEEEADAQRDQDDSDDRSGQLGLLDALDQDGHERTQRGDADGGVEERGDHVEGQPKRGSGGGGEHRQRDPRG